MCRCWSASDACREFVALHSTRLRGPSPNLLLHVRNLQVLCPLSLLWPFLQPSSQAGIAAALQQPRSNQAGGVSLLQLQPGTTLKMLMPMSNNTSAPLSSFPCTLEGHFTVSSAAAALEGMLADVQRAGSASSWTFAWQLGSGTGSSAASNGGAMSASRLFSAFSSASKLLPAPATVSALVAVLAVDQPQPSAVSYGAPHPAQLVPQQASSLGYSSPSTATTCESCISQVDCIPSSPPQPQPGMHVVAVGSPFGCLAPHHFSLAHMQGCVSTVHSSSLASTGPNSSHTHNQGHMQSQPAVFTVDAPCLPGMEGGLVYLQDPQGQAQGSPVILGMLGLPLSRSSDAVQLPLALSWPLVLEAFRQYCSGSGSPTNSSTGSSSASGKEAGSRGLLQGAEGQGTVVASAAAGTDSSSSRSSGIHPWPTLGLEPCDQGILRSPEACSSCGSNRHAGIAGLLRMHAPVSEAMQGVVLVRTQGSWATAVLVTPCHLITNAHLLQPALASPPAPGAPGKAPGQPNDSTQSSSSFGAGMGRPPQPSTCMVRATDSAGLHHWLTARVVFIFSNHLDLAVLQLEPNAAGSSLGGSIGSLGSRPQSEALPFLRPVSLPPAYVQPQQQPMGHHHATQQPKPHSEPSQQLRNGELFVLGHGLFGPSAGWPCAVTRGNCARVVHARGQPCMLITTATVHSGASGGAVVDGQGRLCGLVTSNTK